MKYFIISLFCYFSFISVSAAQEHPRSVPAGADASAQQTESAANSVNPSAAVSSSTEAVQADSVAASTEAVQADSVAASTASVQANASEGQSDISAEQQPPERPKDKSYFNPVRNHNPMMSPRDYDNIRRAEQAKLEAEREAKLAAERAAQMQQAGYDYNPETKVVRKKVNPIAILEKRLRLQGIMGNMVIINGETYSKGDVILRTGGAKVKTIGGNYIIVEYKGKTFRKVMKN